MWCFPCEGRKVNPAEEREEKTVVNIGNTQVQRTLFAIKMNVFMTNIEYKISFMSMFGLQKKKS